ncbi:MAG: alpha/beta hydrolase [Hyphomonadaceae bacterium]
MRFLTKMLARAAINRSDEALIRASGGSPRVAGGRTLDPRFQFIEAQSRKAAPPPELTPAIGRAQTDGLVYMFGGKREPGVHAESLTIDLGDRRIPARLYHPARRDPSVPVLVFYHFGGGVVGNLDTCDAFCTILANETKGSVLSVDYRLAPEHRFPAGLNDAIDAFKWAVENAQRFDGPAGKAAIGGDSMGGNFSAIVTQEMKRTGGPLPVVQLLIYPATDIASTHPSMTTYADAFPLTAQTMAWFMANYLPEGTDPKQVRLSPANEPNLAGLPPALIYTAGFDVLSDQGKEYADKLKAAGVPVTYHCFDSLAHGFTAFTGAIPAADAACRRIARETAAAMKA